MGIDFGSHFILVVEHQYQAVWSSTAVESLLIAYDADNDLPHIGIILLCEVLAPSLLNMHECLK